MTSYEIEPLIDQLPYDEKIRIIKMVLDKLGLPPNQTNKTDTVNQLLLPIKGDAKIEIWSPIECSYEDQQLLENMLTQPLKPWEIEAMQRTDQAKKASIIHVI